MAVKTCWPVAATVFDADHGFPAIFSFYFFLHRLLHRVPGSRGWCWQTDSGCGPTAASQFGTVGAEHEAAPRPESEGGKPAQNKDLGIPGENGAPGQGGERQGCPSGRTKSHSALNCAHAQTYARQTRAVYTTAKRAAAAARLIATVPDGAMRERRECQKKNLVHLHSTIAHTATERAARALQTVKSHAVGFFQEQHNPLVHPNINMGFAVHSRSMTAPLFLFFGLFPAFGSPLFWRLFPAQGPPTVSCSNTSYSCPALNTCCPRPGGTYGCAPFEAGAAQCCPGRSGLACPAHYRCVVHATRAAVCVSPEGPQPDPRLSAAWPYPSGMAGWQLPYRTCPAFPGAPPRLWLPLGAAAGHLVFPYYSNAGALGPAAAHAATLRKRDIEAALIVVQGAIDNADDYFCSGLRAAALQRAFSARAVAVIAPHFVERPDPLRPRAAWWNGSFPSGHWRAGGDTDPAASGGGPTVSSFAILDRMVQTLVGDRATYPRLRLVAIAGHSAGGQLVQRHALCTRLPVRRGDAAVRVRHVVANPSDFVYLDGRRWRESALREVTRAERAACPLYDSWHFGIAASVPPSCRAARTRTGIAAFRTRDVRYLQGNNDTCNEAFLPGCRSHGLGTTCMDMLQGRFRLERGRQYFAYLQAFFGAPVHRLRVVPDVGHDHTLMWDASLSDIFGE